MKQIKSISLTYPLSDNYAAELNLIEHLCRFQNIQCIRHFPDSDMYRKHYKGLYPAIIIDGSDVVLYGFWSFVRYLDNLGFEEYD